MVYRYLDKELVNAFFNEGKLRLSSFNKFRKHSDEHRGDKDEGENLIIGNMKDKQFMTMISPELMHLYYRLVSCIVKNYMKILRLKVVL